METSANATDNPTASTVRRMRSEATTHETPIPGWVLILLLAPLALLLGFAAGAKQAAIRARSRAPIASSNSSTTAVSTTARGY